MADGGPVVTVNFIATVPRRCQQVVGYRAEIKILRTVQLSANLSSNRRKQSNKKRDSLLLAIFSTLLFSMLSSLLFSHLEISLFAWRL